MATIAFVEDDQHIAQELSVLLTKAGHNPCPIQDFEHAVDEILQSAADLVLLDLNLPGTDGSYICSDLRSKSDIPIIILTSRTGEVSEVMCITLGADDFIDKPYSSSILLARIEALLRRTNKTSQSTLNYKGLSLNLSRSELSFEGKSVELTKNELKLLHLLIKSAGSIVPRETLMAELWDSGDFVDDNTLTVNINRVRAALAKLGQKELLHTHRGQGYSI